MASPFDPFATELKAALIDEDKVDPPFGAVFEGRHFPDDDRLQVAMLESEPPVELESFNAGSSLWSYSYLVRYRIRMADDRLGDEQKDRSERAAQAVLDRYRYSMGLANLGETAFAGFTLHYTEAEALGIDATEDQYEVEGTIRITFVGVR